MFNEHKSNRRKKFLLIPFAIAGFVLLLGWFVMLLWNAILPNVVTGVSVLTYWQAMGLLVLSKLLFSGFPGKPRPHAGSPMHWRDKWRNMSEEERQQFKAKWRERCNKRPE
jgi:Ca2+/H+ antiporter, TMEM165/GDT1 family